MAGRSDPVPTMGRVERLCASTLDERALRVALVAELRRSIGFDAYVWLLTDPVTTVGSNPVADVPAQRELPTLIRSKYSSLVNRWTTLTQTPHRVALLSRAVDEPDDRWRCLLSAYDIVDVASTVFHDRHGCWGFLDLWRHRSAGPFTEADVALVAAVGATITTALRRRQAAAFALTGSTLPPDDGPAVLILDDDLQITGQTSAATAWLQRLLPGNAGLAPVPAAAYNVAAQLLANDAGADTHPAAACTYVPGFTWITVRASRLTPLGPSVRGSIAVSMEKTSGAQRLEVYGRAHALSPREHDLLRLLARGLDTRELATSMSISEYTVGDHLKSIFAKTDVNSRTAILTAALGVDR